MKTTGVVWKYAEYARLPDDGDRYEVIDGEVLVTPAPGTFHQHVAANLFVEVRGYVERHGLGSVLWDVDLLFVEGQFLRPDFLYVPIAGRAGITDRGVWRTPASESCIAWHSLAVRPKQSGWSVPVAGSRSLPWMRCRGSGKRYHP